MTASPLLYPQVALLGDLPAHGTIPPHSQPLTPPAWPTGPLPLAFDYDHVSLVPRVASTLTPRADAEPEVTVGPVRLRLPLLGAPMPDVCGPEMCRALAAGGALGVPARFQPVGGA